MCICLDLVQEEWMVCRIFQKSAGGKRSSIELISRNEYRDLPGSPSLPSLLESPCNTTAANNQEPRSSENESVTSAKAHDLFHCSIPVEPRANLAGQHLHQFQSESNSSYLDSSGQLSKMATLMKQSSYMHNLVLKDQRIHMNMIPATASFSLSNMRSDHISAILDQHRGIQQLPCLLSPVPSNSSNLEFSNALVGQSAGSPIEPFSTSCVLNKTLSINNTMGVNNCVHSFQWGNGGLSQKLLDQPIQEVDAGLTGLSTDMNDEMTFDVCNPLDRPLDQLDSYTAPPVDFDSLWNMREVQQDRVWEDDTLAKKRTIWNWRHLYCRHRLESNKRLILLFRVRNFLILFRVRVRSDSPMNFKFQWE